jgi:hypothetical protein
MSRHGRHIIQGEAGGKCRKLSKEMEFFAQIDSEDEANLMWEDFGLVYLFRCSDHTSEFHFGIACH